MLSREQGPGAHRIDPEAIDEPQGNASAPNRFKLLTIPEVLDRPPRQYLVRGILGRGELAVLYGPPASGKTFVAIDLALSIAADQDWHGCAVHAGPVVYVAAEGSGGFGLRLKAWIKHYEKGNDLPLYAVDGPIQFMSEGDVDEFIEALKGLSNSPALIVLDTLARCLDGGDENMARDMGRLISGCDRIRRATGATVLLVHHSAKSHRAERGSSALRGAVDTALEASVSEAGDVILGCSKQKDEAPFEEKAFKMEVIALGEDEAGFPISSCCLSPKWSGTDGGESHDGLGPTRSTMCQVLRDSFFENGATSEQWREASRVSRSASYRHQKVLVEEGYVERFKHQGRDRFRIGKRFPGTSNPTVPPSPTQSQGPSGTSPTPTPPPIGGSGGTGTGTETEKQTFLPYVEKPRTCDG